MSPELGIEQEQEAVAQEPVSKGPCPGGERICTEDGSVWKEGKTGIKLLHLQVGQLRGQSLESSMGHHVEGLWPRGRVGPVGAGSAQEG